jgi:hypothetical protein
MIVYILFIILMISAKKIFDKASLFLIILQIFSGMEVLNGTGNEAVSTSN